MSLDGGLGGVVTGRKNLNLGAATAFEDIQAVPNADGTGYWVITSTAGTGNVLAYAFDGNGPVTGTPVVTPLPNVLAGTAGYHRIQVSPDGSQLLLMSGDVAVDRMWLLDFDGATGRMYPRVMWTGGGSEPCLRRGLLAVRQVRLRVVHRRRPTAPVGHLVLHHAGPARGAPRARDRRQRIGRAGPSFA